MADTKISALAAAAAALGAMELPVNDAGASKKITLTQLRTLLQTLGMPRVFAMTADHAISATLATEVTQLGTVTLEAGTYVFQYFILAQAATAGVSPMFGINFTGTAAVRKIVLRYVGTGTAASTGVADDDVAAPLATGNVYEGQIVGAFATTAPNMGSIAGIATINQNTLYVIEGVLIVTASGDLELWHGSETATSTTVKAGTSLVVTRTA